MLVSLPPFCSRGGEPLLSPPTSQLNNVDVGQLLKEYDLLIVLFVWSTKELFPWAKSRLDLATNRNSNRVSTIQSLYERLLQQNERQMTQNSCVSTVIAENTEAYHQVFSAISANTLAVDEMRQVVQQLKATVERQLRNVPQ